MAITLAFSATLDGAGGDVYLGRMAGDHDAPKSSLGTIVVTGGSGQLGSLVVARLCASRKVKRVVSLDLVAPSVVSAKLDWKIADVRDPGLERHFEGASALVHLAFIVVRRAPAETMHAVNVEASKKMFAHAINHGASAIVYSSSVAAYGIDGPHPEPLVEDSPRRPTPWLAYAENKWQVEQHLDELEPKHPDVRFVRLRPSTLLGRRMDDTFARPLRRRVLPRFGSGRVPIVWDEDVADAVLLALLSEARGAFNLSADEPLTAEELAKAGGMTSMPLPKAARAGWTKLAPLLDRSGKAGDPAWLRAGELDMVVSSERAKRELGWNPSCPTARAVIQRFAAEVPNKTDPRIRTFLRMIDVMGRRFAPAELPEEARRLKVELHLNLTGPRGGDFSVSLNEGKVKIRSGIPRPPETVLTMRAETLLELLSGKTDLSAARMTGKVRLQGEPQGAYFLGAMVTGFRNSTAAPGVRGWSAGRLSRWFERGTGNAP
jgi:nucleoside-diphosphate-sugar epimerase/putative sterol carrier protein